MTGTTVTFIFGQTAKHIQGASVRFATVKVGQMIRVYRDGERCGFERVQSARTCHVNGMKTIETATGAVVTAHIDTPVEVYVTAR